MRKLWFFVLTIFAVSTVGCSSDGGGYDDPYASVRPGVTIYNCSENQMMVSGDAASVAVRLAMLIDEAAAKGVSIENVTVDYKEGEYLLKNLLFGAKTDIADLGNGDYKITFDKISLATLDDIKRHGSYTVHTSGKSLAQSYEDEAWTVEVSSDSMLLFISDGFNTLDLVVTGGTTMLYRMEGGAYTYVVENSTAHFAGYDTMSSDWSGSFVWGPATLSDELSFSTHMSDSYTMYGTANGVSFYTFDNKVCATMKYYVPYTAPLKWQPSKTANYRVITDGDVTSSLVSPLEYPIEYYPSPFVVVSRTSDKNTIYTTVTYNGETLKI